MRLDAFISQNTDLTRSHAQIAIKNKRVSVDGTIIKTLGFKVTGAEKILLDDTPVEILTARYFMLNKPAGYVCANTDADHPTVLDLMDVPNKQLLQIAGRLDLDTTGLVLLTDDGQWNHRITAPRRECTKTYLVTTADAITAETIQRFKVGVELHGEKNLTLPAELEILSSNCARLHIQEGKYHQVKRMFAAVGNLVVGLHREQVGKIALDPSLAPGQYRALTTAEIDGV